MLAVKLCGNLSTIELRVILFKQMIYQKELTEQPMPPRNRYRFDNMKPGDHMRFDDPRVAESARVSAAQFVKRHQLDWRFSLRKMKDAWRLFRIE